MFRLTGLLLSLISIFSLTQNASAQSIYDQRDSAAYAGLYVSIPFGHTARKIEDEYKLGFKAGLRQDRRFSRNGLTKTSSFTADVVDLNFSQQGFNKLTLAGIPVVYTDIYGRAHYLGEDEDSDGGSTIGKIALWSLGIVVGAAVIVAVAVEVCFDEDDENEDVTFNC